MGPSLHVSLLVLALLLRAGSALAVCDTIPGTQRTFRGALATVDRPFARPGDTLDLRIDPGCHGASPGFSRSADHGRDFALARYLLDGRPDPTFGGQCAWEDRPLTRPAQ
jgi:hypothetical protein